MVARNGGRLTQASRAATKSCVALADVLHARDLPRELFDGMIDARECDLDPEPFANLAALEAYADATSGNLMRLAARILDAGGALDDLAREAGIAYALTGLLRAFPFHAARRNLTLPRDMLGEAGLMRKKSLPATTRRAEIGHGKSRRGSARASASGTRTSQARCGLAGAASRSAVARCICAS